MRLLQKDPLMKEPRKLDRLKKKELMAECRKERLAWQRLAARPTYSIVVEVPITRPKNIVAIKEDMQ